MWPFKQSFWVILSYSCVRYFTVVPGSTFWVCGLSPFNCVHPVKAVEQCCIVGQFIVLYYMASNFESVDEIFWCYHSNEKLLSSIFLQCCLFCNSLQVEISFWAKFRSRLTIFWNKNRQYKPLESLLYITWKTYLHMFPDKQEIHGSLCVLVTRGFCNNLKTFLFQNMANQIHPYIEPSRV